MKKLVLLLAFWSSCVFSGLELDTLAVADNDFLDDSRGMVNISSQNNVTDQGGVVSGNNMSNSFVLTGKNTISPNSFSGSNGIIMINLSSGNNNVTNMSTSINIISAR